MYYYTNHYFQKENYTMSDNKLLAENTIRRFMKLANTETFSDNFVNEMGYGKSPAQADEDDREKNEAFESDDEVVAEQEDELDAGAPEGEDDMEMDMEMDAEEPTDAAEPEMGAADMSLTEEEAQLLIDLGERLSSAMGAAEDDDAGAEDDMAAMDDMGDMGGMEPGAEEEAPAGRDMMGMTEGEEEDLVNEVLKRVTKRLVAEKLKNRK